MTKLNRITCHAHVVAQINKLRSLDGLRVGVDGNHWVQVWSSVVHVSKDVFYCVDQLSMKTLFHETCSFLYILDTPTVQQDVGKNTLKR